MSLPNLYSMTAQFSQVTTLLSLPNGLTQWLPFLDNCFLLWSLDNFVPGQATVTPPLSIQVPVPSPGYSSSAGLPACLSAPPTASSGPLSHLPAPSRKCGLSLPSWVPRPPAQVCWVPGMEEMSPSQDLALSPVSPSPRQWLLAGADAPGCCECAPADRQWDRGATLRPHSPVPACALGASCPRCGHQHSSLEV